MPEVEMRTTEPPVIVIEDQDGVVVDATNSPAAVISVDVLTENPLYMDIGPPGPVGPPGPQGPPGMVSPWVADVDAAGFQLYNASRIGVGVASPQVALDVAGNIQASGGVLAGYVSGLAGAALSLRTNGTQRLVIDTSGLVYIAPVDGQTSSQIDMQGSGGGYISADSALTLRTMGASPLFLSTNATQRVVIDASGYISIPPMDGQTYSQIDMQGSGGAYFSADTQLTLRSIGAYPLTLATGATARLTIDGSGNVGIGTSSPQSLLHVSGGRIELQGDQSAIFHVPSSGSGGFLTGVREDISSGNFVFDSLSGDWIFLNHNVGIGTTSPQAMLDVAGAVHVAGRLTVNVASGPILVVQQGAADYYWSLASTMASDSDDLYCIADANSSGYAWATRNAAGAAVFAGGIDCNGNWGIGTGSPQAKLDVAGSVNVSKATSTPAITVNDSATAGDSVLIQSTSRINDEFLRIYQNGSAYAGSALSLTMAQGSGSFTGSFIYCLNGGAASFIVDCNGRVSGNSFAVNAFGVVVDTAGNASFVGINASGTMTAPELIINRASASSQGVVVNDLSGVTGGAGYYLHTAYRTDGDLIGLYQDTSAFAGSALTMNMASGSGTFTGYFLLGYNAGVAKILIDSAGNTTLGGTLTIGGAVVIDTSHNCNFALVTTVGVVAGGVAQKTSCFHAQNGFWANNLQGQTTTVTGTFNVGGTAYTHLVFTGGILTSWN
jgi:hypothetical protein